MEGLHFHCLNCVNRRCMIRTEASISCDLMGCPLVCGAVFHSCKLNEHLLLCPYERVPCLNFGFGCPFTIARVKMAQHLKTCPASVVCCTMEWNRWPVSYADSKSYENLSKDVCDVEQLDMALALQDQRMLLESLKVATTVTKNVEEQNQENERLNSDTENELIKTDEEPFGQPYIASVENSIVLAETLEILSSAKNIDLIVDNRNGEEENGACTNFRNGDGDPRNDGMKESDTDSDSELGAVGGADCPFPVDPEEEGDDWLGNNGYGESSEEEEEENGGIELNGYHDEGNDDNLVKLKKVLLDGAATINGSSNVRQVLPYHSMPIVAREPEMAPLAQLPLPLPIALPNLMHNNVLHHLHFRIEDRWLERKLENLQVLRGMSLFTINGRRSLFSDPYLFKAKMEDKAVDTSDLDVADDPMGLHGIDLITAALLFCLGDSPGGRGISDSRFVDGYRIDFGTQTFSLPSAILATNTMVGDIASASACDHASPQLSNPSPFHTLRLDLVLECVARYQTKQRSMFTFVCGQLFRRDEFSSHFKNVHGDIHAGLNGWMEQRCPLAYYGCTYSQRRFCPSVQGFRIIHDRHLGSFGVQPGLAEYSDEPLSRNTCQFDSHCDHLSDMPFELLQHIASFLDGFSLCQLSRVSRTMIPANLFLRVERCWATPTKDPYSNIQYTFIRDSCPVLSNDQTLAVMKNGQGPEALFRVQMFKFVGSSYTDVFLHCNVQICHNTGGVCQPNCSVEDTSVRIRRNVASSHTVSYGPIRRLKANIENTSQGAKIPPVETFVLGGLLFVLILVTGVFGKLWLQSRNSYPTQEAQLTLSNIHHISEVAS